MNYYRVTRAHRNRAIGETIESDTPQDSYLSVIGFLKYLGADEVPKMPVKKERKSRGVKVGSEPGGSAAVRDSGSNGLGGEDGSEG